MENIVHFDFNSNPNDTPKIIKVIGVGGGGGNAVKHMYQEGIHDVTFALCNTDLQALRQSEIPVKIQLGPKTTQGLGAGNDPKVAREAAEEIGVPVALSVSVPVSLLSDAFIVLS